MANLNEQPIWQPTINQIDSDDPILGEADGVLNKATKQLADRTRWLEQQFNAIQVALDKKSGATA